MVKRMIRFPLKMKNGAEVRSLEELRSNADVESVMQYYFSGQLSRWCRVFNINELPEKITENNEMFVKKVLEVIGIELSEAEIKDYVDRKFGNSTEVKEKTGLNWYKQIVLTQNQVPASIKYVNDINYSSIYSKLFRDLFSSIICITFAVASASTAPRTAPRRTSVGK